MKKIRVLRIIGECKTGGTETIALNYYKNLDHRKIDMDFLFYGESLQRFDDELKNNNNKVYNVIEYKKSMIKSIMQIKKIVKENNYDIVHAQLNSLNFFPLLGAWLGGAKVRVASNHSTANLKFERKKSILKYILRPTCGLTATDYAACSKHAAIWAFGKRKYKNGKVKVIPNAIDLEKFRYSESTRKKVRKKEKWEDKFVIGHAGRFIEQKNHRFIIEIFNEVYKKNKNAILVLIGDGDLLEEIKKQVKDLKLEKNVYFYGVRFDVNELMQGMDLFLFPSLYEGLGNVITESQAVALQSLSSDSVPNEVKMTEYAEFLPLSYSAKEWSNKILEYSNGYKKRDTYNDLKKSGYEIKSAAQNLYNYYKSLISER